MRNGAYGREIAAGRQAAGGVLKGDERYSANQDTYNWKRQMKTVNIQLAVPEGMEPHPADSGQALSTGTSDIVRYIVFDVETPNRYNNRMSAIGISVVEGASITGSFFSYVNPEQPFDWFNTRLTGIDEDTVADAPTFGELWERIEPILSSGILVAHNASFDMGVLKKCLRDYGISWRKTVPCCCTVMMGRRLLPGIGHKLNELCDYYGIELDHHKADSDSRAAAEILMRYVRGGAAVEEFVREYCLG